MGRLRGPRAEEATVRHLRERLERLDEEARALARELLAAGGRLRSPEAQAARARLERVVAVYAAGADLVDLMR